MMPGCRKLIYWSQNQYPSVFNRLVIWVQTNEMNIISKMLVLSIGVSSICIQVSLKEIMLVSVQTSE